MPLATISHLSNNYLIIFLRNYSDMPPSINLKFCVKKPHKALKKLRLKIEKKGHERLPDDMAEIFLTGKTG